MIPSRYLKKKVKSTRTYRFKIQNDLTDKFSHAQMVKRLYFNYALKYLYQHHGTKHLDHYLPSGQWKNYFINDLKTFARQQALKHDIDLKKMDYSVQSIDKALNELYIAFNKYRKAQMRIKYWFDKNKEQYLKTHDCTLSGYGRINYKHSDNEVTSVTFKQNHDRIDLIDNYRFKVPYFGIIRSTKSLTNLKHKSIQEARILLRANGDFELQVVTKFEKQKDLDKEACKNLIGLDVNLANNDFFAFSDGEVESWTKEVETKYKELDTKYRKLQNYITTHNHGNDGSRTAKIIKAKIAKIKAKIANIIDNWQLECAKQFSQKYPILAMEQLNSFTMRMSKRSKDYKLRKNTNHKLATIQPTSFRKMMETVYQNDGHLLLEVNSIDTSKNCSNCNCIYHDLKVGEKKWKCPECQAVHDRDYNAALNIKNWAENPKQHAVLRQRGKYPYINENDLVIAY